MMYVWSRTKYEISIKNNEKIHTDSIVFMVMMMLITFKNISLHINLIDLPYSKYFMITHQLINNHIYGKRYLENREFENGKLNLIFIYNKPNAAAV